MTGERWGRFECCMMDAFLRARRAVSARDSMKLSALSYQPSARGARIVGACAAVAAWALIGVIK